MWFGKAGVCVFVCIDCCVLVVHVLIQNDAEKMLADMEFCLDEHPSERELKLQVIRIYNHKLEERNRRKRFVIERGLVDFKHQQSVCERDSVVFTAFVTSYFMSMC